MAKKKEAKKKGKKKTIKKSKKKKVKKKTSKKKVSRKKLLARIIIREVTVRYGGVIRTGSYENRRVSYEMTADCPRGLKPDTVLKYLETIVVNQFYQAQVEALEGLPPDMRDELGDFSRMSPQEGAQRIGEFFRNYVPPKKQISPEQKTELIEKLQKELKELALKIRQENKRLKGLKDITGKDLEWRAEMVEQQHTIKNELRLLRKENKNGN